MSVPATHLHRGTREYRQASAVLFGAGFMAFSLLYVVQGTLPAVSGAFDVSPAAASLLMRAAASSTSPAAPRNFWMWCRPAQPRCG